MTTFSYTAMEPSGRKRTGFIDASDKRAAIAAVTAEGRYVLEMNEESRRSVRSSESKVEERKGRTTKGDIALFTRRLADLSGAGLPLDRVLRILSEQTESAQLAHIAEEALEDVKRGLPVSQALEKFPKFFPPMFTQTLRAGEASGQFSESATRLADLMENEVARRSQIVSAMIYPAVLTFTAVFVVIFLLAFVVPRLTVVFEGLGDTLPLSTKILLATTAVITGYWIEILVGLVILIVGLKFYLGTPAGKEARDAAVLKAPGIGKVAKKAIVSRYARVLGTLVKGGVPILDALHLAGMAAGNSVFIRSNAVVGQEVKEGKTIAGAMRDAGDFPPVLTHMVAIGEETGDLPKMLNRVSDSLDFEVEQGLRRLTTLVEPIIVLVMGAFVAFVVLSVLLPIFGAQELIK